MTLIVTIKNVTRFKFNGISAHHGLNSVTSANKMPDDTLDADSSTKLEISQHALTNIGKNHFWATTIWAKDGEPMNDITRVNCWGVRVDNYAQVFHYFGAAPDWSYIVNAPPKVFDYMVAGWTERQNDDRVKALRIDHFADYYVDIDPTGSDTSIELVCTIRPK